MTPLWLITAIDFSPVIEIAHSEDDDPTRLYG